MIKKLGLIGLAAAAAAAAGMMACGENILPSAGCTGDSECQTGEICHPDLKVCVRTCSSGSDCSDEAKNCEAISSTNNQKICKCVTNQLCAGGPLGSTAVCNTTYNVCLNSCTSDSDCPAGSGLTCDTGTGQCVKGASDGGTGGDAGACSWATCSTTAWMGGTPQQCTDSTCGAGPACSGTGQTTCDYGSSCTAGSCGYPNYPTQAACGNFYTGDHTSGPQWNPKSSNGPVIYSLTEIGHGPGQGTGGTNFKECTTSQTEWKFSIRAYRTDMDWPDTRAGLSGFKYVPTNGKDIDILKTPSLLLPNVGYNRNPANPKDAEFEVYVCAENAANNLQPGFYFVGGNEACNQF